MLLKNSVRTPDGTEIVSRHRHDMCCYTDKNGKRYCIDGGNNYFRFIGDLEDCEDTSLHTGMSHEELRKGVAWETHIKTEDGYNTKYILIRDLSTAHINNIIDDGYAGNIVGCMAVELQWRKDNEKGAQAKRLEIQRENSYG